MGSSCNGSTTEGSGERCFACKGPYHPASGHRFEAPFADVVYCGACIRPFIVWLKGMMSRKWGKLDFYAEARVSCSARNSYTSPDPVV